MSTIVTRRHQRWHEEILLSHALSVTLGWLLAVALPGWLLWGEEGLLSPNPGQKYALLVASAAYLLSQRAVHALSRYPGTKSALLVLPQVVITFGALTLATMYLRADLSRLLMASSGVLTLLWCYCELMLRKRLQQPRLAVVPQGMARELFLLPGIDAYRIDSPRLAPDHRTDGVVADLNAISDPDWERFLAQCALSRIPVYHAGQLAESLSGRVRIHHVSENPMGSLLPSPSYERFKYLFDASLIVLTLPITLPLALVTALAIKLESPGPVLFTQERVGQGNRSFRMVKFRSMVNTSERDGARFASQGDSRVTRVGRVIRKLRIDEIPQFLNVLNGDMSLIGPRPEQRTFVDQFDRDIPFYSYRHVVKPGITGWAQVMQGYAASADDTRLKIELDFYYIKHCSVSLDLLIVFRTIQTILTGFGAR